MSPARGPVRRRPTEPPELKAGPLNRSADVTMDLLSFLTRAGWEQGRPGVAGSLWSHPRAAARVAVPVTVRSDSLEWDAILERLSAWAQLPTAQVREQVQCQFIDVARMQASNDVVISGSIPLSAGASLVTSAAAMLRAAATTSVRLRSHIGGGFSKLGDDVVAQARMAHTEEGSFIVPVLMPLTRPASDDGTLFEGSENLRVVSEPSERRVTRTLAQALSALSTRVVQPGLEVSRTALNPFVEAGGSRELVFALSRILAEPTVASFEAQFAWAGGVEPAQSLPEAVEVPAAARELLLQTTKLLLDRRMAPAQLLSGPIVEVRHQPDDPFGEIAIQTHRRGRPCEVRVTLSAAQVVHAHAWAVAKRVVLVDGEVEAGSGRLIIRNPTRVQPLDETMFPDAG